MLGANVIAGHLAVVLLIDIIRHHLARHADGEGRLHGLNDPVVGAALRAMHADPARRWTVRLLAEAAHVSRSTLAARFKSVVGRGPLEHLTRWRIELAAHRLAATGQTVAVIANAVGYGSEAALAHAFKRELGTPPRAVTASRPAGPEDGEPSADAPESGATRRVPAPVSRRAGTGWFGASGDDEGSRGRSDGNRWEVAVDDGDLELGELLAAAESAPPGGSVDVVARNLQKRFGARHVSFLFVDLIGQRLARLSAAAGGDVAGFAEPIALRGSVYDGVLQSQRQHVEPDGRGGQRVITPVTNRGDCIGVLEVVLRRADDGVLRKVGEAAHLLAYIIVTDRRFTDLYHLGRRTTPTSLAAEIQHQLLPSAPCCEADRFTLAAGLVPADDIGGDTYDYTLERDTLHLSITDAMGHDTDSALLATVLVSALRRARRRGCDALLQANEAHQALLEQGRGLATGQLLCVDLDTGDCELVNAGHPRPLRLRDGTVEEVELGVNLPFGVVAPTPYRLQKLDLRPGDRLVLLTDGMQERRAAAVDLAAVIGDTRDLHPRETVRALTSRVLAACHGELSDDATVMVLDWHGDPAR